MIALVALKLTIIPICWVVFRHARSNRPGVELFLLTLPDHLVRPGYHPAGPGGRVTLLDRVERAATLGACVVLVIIGSVVMAWADVGDQL